MKVVFLISLFYLFCCFFFLKWICVFLCWHCSRSVFCFDLEFLLLLLFGWVWNVCWDLKDLIFRFGYLSLFMDQIFFRFDQFSCNYPFS
jgi:hypothetical protein